MWHILYVLPYCREENYCLINHIRLTNYTAALHPLRYSEILQVYLVRVRVNNVVLSWVNAKYVTRLTLQGRSDKSSKNSFNRQQQQQLVQIQTINVNTNFSSSGCGAWSSLEYKYASRSIFRRHSGLRTCTYNISTNKQPFPDEHRHSVPLAFFI